MADRVLSGQRYSRRILFSLVIAVTLHYVIAPVNVARGEDATPHVAQQSAPRITTPKEFFGFQMGDDYCLANYQQLLGYWTKLERESDRLKVVCIGASEEGRPQMMAVVTSPANHAQLARYQPIAQRLARAEGVSDDEAKQLAREGKAVVWIDGGLHASETLCAQALIETLYQLLAANDEETLRILDDIVILLVHANPDGMDLVADWYMRTAEAKKRSLTGLPRLYQKYIGHDNNRDFYAATQAETKNMNRVMYYEWLPQIVYNHHQSGPPGTVLFCPPFRDPFNYNVDPLVISGIDAVGAAMMQRFLAEGKPGATTRSGARYSTWWNGGLRTTCYFHNMIGLLTETIGSPTPMQIPFRPELQLPRADYLSPIEPQTWHFRQSVDYSVTANKAILDYASRHREQLLHNIWLMGRRAIDRGSRDHWTVTPKMVPPKMEEPARGKKGSPRSGADEYARHFREKAKRDPRGYIIPASQPDFLTAAKFVNTLLDTGVRVHRATADFQVGGKRYPAGSYVVKCAQAFRSHVLDMFEPQDHPSDFAYPGAAPTPPYDIAGWTLAMQMAVEFDRVLDGLDGPFEEIYGPVVPPVAGIVRAKDINGEKFAGYLLDPRLNDAYRAVNRLLASGHEVRRLSQATEVDGKERAAGTFFIPDQAAVVPVIERIAAELGTPFIASPAEPASEAAIRVKPVRIGLWDRYGGSMQSGWTRWLLERFEYPFQVVFPPALDAGSLRDKFDVLIFVDGAIPAAAGSAVSSTSRAGGSAEGTATTRDDDLPAEYRGRRGSITAAKTVPRLREFLEAGGTILTIGSSTSLAQHLKVPLKNHLVTTTDGGKEQALPREKFYVPGSLLAMRVDTTSPLAWGLGERADVMFSASPTYRLADDAQQGNGDGATIALRRVAWFEGKTPLRSGWAWGQEHLDGGLAVIDAQVGNGRLVLSGPEILFRAQPHGTFKFLFNTILAAGRSP